MFVQGTLTKFGKVVCSCPKCSEKIVLDLKIVEENKREMIQCHKCDYYETVVGIRKGKTKIEFTVK
jgi:Zn ribbon nucleic-acid-binding protein